MLFVTLLIVASNICCEAFTRQVLPFHPPSSAVNHHVLHERAIQSPLSVLSSTPSHLKTPPRILPSPTELSSSSVDVDDEELKRKTLRDSLRAITGFSLTAFRATARATTGLSLTAIRASLRAATGVSITGTMKFIFEFFPTWFRYFLQPFLVMYYAPLLILRSWVGPTKTSRAEAKASHELVLQGWKDAIEVAEAAQEGGYWPVHVNEEGYIEASLPPDADSLLSKKIEKEAIDVPDAVANSVEIAMRANENIKKE